MIAFELHFASFIFGLSLGVMLILVIVALVAATVVANEDR